MSSVQPPYFNICALLLFLGNCNSVNHKYKEWNGEKTKLTTCQRSANFYIGGRYSIQEIHTNEEVVFTYDVSFEVALASFLSLSFLFSFCSVSYMHISHLFSPVISSGNRVGTHTSTRVMIQCIGLPWSIH